MVKKHMWQVLGWSGVLPFVIFLFLTQVKVTHIPWSSSYLFIVYSACILSFLSGSVWLKGAIDKQQVPTLYSNVVTILAFACVILNNSWSFLLLIVGYITILAIEFRYDLFEQRPSGYKFMRVWVTNVVIACHVLMFIP